jgi:Ca2+:H+ antiporter
MGFSMLVGGWKRDKQTFEGAVASSQSTMLLLACVALVLPATFQLSLGGGLPSPEADAHRFSHDLEVMSALVSIVLLGSYAAGLFFSLKTHRDIFNPDMEADDDEDHAGWSVRRCVMWLAVAGIGVGFMSEILVGSIEEASHGIGLSPFFVSLIVVAIAGNAAEHWVAVYFAWRDKLDLSVAIAIGSSAQIALFVFPALVLVSFVLGPFPMALELNGLELGSIVLAVIIATHVTHEGVSTWFEGVQLLAVYVVLGMVFFFV